MSAFFSLFIVYIFTTITNAQYNYLCDYNTSFTDNGVDAWSWNTSTCHLKQENDCVCSSIAWLGDNIPSSLTWTDYTLTTTVSITSGSSQWTNAGLIFRAQNIGNKESTNSGTFYLVSISTIYTPSIGLYELRSGQWNYKSEKGPSNIYYNTDYELRIVAKANAFSIYLNDLFLFNDTSNTFVSGSIGLRTRDSTAVFKSLYIDGIPTISPTSEPSITPTTNMPTPHPTVMPSVFPTAQPTKIPTSDPTVLPSMSPPSEIPPQSPSSMYPTIEPTEYPSVLPTESMKTSVNNEIILTVASTSSSMKGSSNGLSTTEFIEKVVSVSEYVTDTVILSLVICVLLMGVCLLAILVYFRIKKGRKSDKTESNIDIDIAETSVRRLSLHEQTHVVSTSEIEMDGLDIDEEMYDKIEITATPNTPFTPKIDDTNGVKNISNMMTSTEGNVDGNTFDDSDSDSSSTCQQTDK